MQPGSVVCAELSDGPVAGWLVVTPASPGMTTAGEPLGWAGAGRHSLGRRPADTPHPLRHRGGEGVSYSGDSRRRCSYRSWDVRDFLGNTDADLCPQRRHCARNNFRGATPGPTGGRPPHIIQIAKSRAWFISVCRPSSVSGAVRQAFTGWSDHRRGFSTSHGKMCCGAPVNRATVRVPVSCEGRLFVMSAPVVALPATLPVSR